MQTKWNYKLCNTTNNSACKSHCKRYDHTMMTAQQSELIQILKIDNPNSLTCQTTHITTTVSTKFKTSRLAGWLRVANKWMA